MSTRVIVPGVEIPLDGCTVYIMNVVRYTWLEGRRRFLVSCRLKCYDKLSKQFIVDVASNDELVRRLKYEIALFKAIIFGGSYDLYASA
jgi:hypothetical protein